MPIENNAINVNSSTPLSALKGGSGVSSPTVHGILIAQGASAFASSVLTNGQLLIGSTGVDPAAATLTAGTGISITNGAGSISIASTQNGGFIWSEITGTSKTIVVGEGYVANNVGLVTFTLPATAVLGDSFCIQGKGAGGWLLAQNANQQINFGNQASSVGIAGSIASTNQWDSLTCVCVTAGASTIWAVRASQGTMTVT